MCEYCDIERLKKNGVIKVEKAEKLLDCGILGIQSQCLFLALDEQDYVNLLFDISGFIERETEEQLALWVPISYCPFCGENLL